MSVESKTSLDGSLTYQLTALSKMGKKLSGKGRNADSCTIQGACNWWNQLACNLRPKAFQGGLEHPKKIENERQGPTATICARESRRANALLKSTSMARPMSAVNLAT